MPWQKLADGSDTVFTMQLQYFTQTEIETFEYGLFCNMLIKMLTSK